MMFFFWTTKYVGKAFQSSFHIKSDIFKGKLGCQQFLYKNDWPLFVLIRFQAEDREKDPEQVKFQKHVSG